MMQKAWIGFPDVYPSEVASLIGRMVRPSFVSRNWFRGNFAQRSASSVMVVVIVWGAPPRAPRGEGYVSGDAWVQADSRPGG